MLSASNQREGSCRLNMLEVKDVAKTYGQGENAVHALRGVTFSVPKGEFVAVVGESGSGKSTLLNMIGALDTPTSGKVVMDGRDLFAMPELGGATLCPGARSRARNGRKRRSSGR